MKTSRHAVLWLLAAVPVFGSCESLAPSDVESGSQPLNQCRQEADCRVGKCDTALGQCVSQDSSLRSVLLEIIPSSSDERFGGRRFFQYVDPTVKAPPELRLLRPPVVRGNIRLAGDNDTCLRDRQLTLTFVPVERHIGVDVLTYRVTSVYDSDPLVGIKEHHFRFDGLPEGVYDVSWEYAHRTLIAPDVECEVVPRLQRGVRIQRVDGKVPPLDLASPLTRSLKVLLPWRDAFEGWRVDVIHPNTLEPLSTAGEFSRERLEPSPDGKSLLGVVDLRLGEVVGADYVEPKQERLRLQPPASENRPTVLLFLKGLELFDDGVVQVPAFNPFETLVSYQTWVWKKNAPEVPVSGIVTFNAVSLSDLPEGNAQLTIRVDIGENGQVEAELPPGRYTLRVRPEIDTELSSFDSSLEVWPPPPSSPQSGTQSGHVVSVPEQRTLGGRVVLPNASGGATDIVVEAEGVPHTGAASPTTRKLVPRTIKTRLVSDRGQFEFSNSDCGACDDTAGAMFDLRVRPPEKSGFPWLVLPNVEVFENLDLGTLQVDAPYIYERKLEFPAPEESDGSFPNALIRAYVPLDNTGTPVLSETLETCDARLLQNPGRTSSRCIARVVQIAETRSRAGGWFKLLLPTTIKSTPN